MVTIRCRAAELPGRAKPNRDVEVWPHTLLVDTREQAPWSFQGMTVGAAAGGGGVQGSVRVPLCVPVESTTLATGDYSVRGFEGVLAVERKSLADLFGTLTRGRERFERELERLEAMGGLRTPAGQAGGFAAVMVEAPLREILRGPPESQVRPESVWGSILAYQLRYPGVRWWFAENRRDAEAVTFRFLKAFVDHAEAGK